MKMLKDDDYILTEGRAWVEVGPFAIRIVKTDEGLAIDVYPTHAEDRDPIVSCWCLDSEAK